MVCTNEPVDECGLVVLDAPDFRERAPQFIVEARGRVLKSDRFHLQTVHEDDAHARERIVVEFADGLLHELPPGEALLIHRGSAGAVYGE